MIKKFLLALFCVSLFASCKNEAKKDVKEATTTSDSNKKDYLEKTFIVSLIGVFEKDDNFQILYSEDEQGYKVKNRISKKITGKNIQQEVVFTLPKGIYPAKLRLDVGSNREQGVISIDSMTISHEENVLGVSGKEFRSYFKPNLWIGKTEVENDNRFKLLIKDIKTSETKTMSYDPYFTSTEKLNNALEVL